MKAVVLNRVGQVELQDCPDPRVLDPGDAVVRITTSGICGSDLHIFHGRDRGFKFGTIMGHEFIGVIEETGSATGNLRKGDRVIAPFTINCGECFYCLRALPARCISSLCFGFVSEDGTGLQGAQAERVLVPLASSTLLKIPERRDDGSELADEELLFLGDIFSTAYSAVEGAGIAEGDTVVVIGCGPVGLLCIVAAKMFRPANIVAVDPVEYRLEKAKFLGATALCSDPDTVADRLKALTDGRGADAAVEAVGNARALDLAIRAARPGAVISIAGYHTADTYSLPIQLAYSKNLSFRIGRCNARKYMSLLLPVVLQMQLPLTEIITHILPLSDAVHGYEIFDRRLESAIKVLLKP